MSSTGRATPQRKPVPPELHAARAIAAMNAANAAAPLLSVLNAGGLLSDGRTRSTLVDGQSGQAWGVGSCTKSDDTTLIKEGTQSKRFTFAGAVTGTATVDPVFPSPAPDPLVFPPASVVRGWFWLDDPTAVTSITLQVYSDSAATQVWAHSFTGFVKGWNLVTIQSSAGVLTGWGSAYRVRLVVATTAATSINVGAIWVESPRKARILLIADRGYASFRDNGLASLRSRGIPVTWALDPTLNGGRVGTPAEVVTESDLASFYALGDDISFHSYDGSVTSSKSPLQIIEDAARGHKYLQDRGYYRGNTWRPAWVQNSAPNHAAAQPYFACYATPSSVSSLTCWPPPDRWNIPRIALHSLTTGTMDSTFASMQATNGLLVCYLHGIDTTAPTENITPTNWAYFLTKIDAAIAGGWLEGVTMTQLLAQRPAPVGSVTYGVPGGVPQVNSWTTAQTDTSYPLPAGAKTLLIRTQGGGGGPGSGRRGAAASIRCGGGGSSAGAYTEWQVNVSDLSVSTLFVTVGAAGTPGAAVTTNDTNGNNGTAGGASYVSTATGSVDVTKALAYAGGGGAGQGGTATTGTGGTAAVGRFSSAAGGAASTTGGVGNGGGNASSAPGSGAAGGGITSADVPSNGGAGGSASGRFTSNPAAGVAPGGNGASSGTLPVLGGGQGGAGGAGSITGPGGTGGNGGPGAGAGGGGASLNGNNSGAAGSPGVGYVEITAYF